MAGLYWSLDGLTKSAEILRSHKTIASALPDISRIVGFPVTSDSVRRAFTRNGLRTSNFLRRGLLTDHACPPPPAPEEKPTEQEPMLPRELNGKGHSGLGNERIRVIIPDSHGCYADPRAIQIFLDDLVLLDPFEIVMLGDHVDCSGVFSSHQPNYAADLEYSYEADCSAANAFLDAIQKRAPRASIHYLEGNHEAHVERWAARMHKCSADAIAGIEALAPATKLRLKERGVKYYRSVDFHGGLSIRGAFKLGKCFFTHGISAAKHATAIHVARFGACVVHGHTHRAQSYVTRTVAADEIGSWCPGTLAALQPTYGHTGVNEWSHGYALQAVEPNGSFLHLNVPIVRGRSLLQPLLRAMKPVHKFG